MELIEIKKEIRIEISLWIQSERKITETSFKRKILDIIDAKAIKKRYNINNEDEKLIVDSLCNDFLGLGPLQKLMDDQNITEIMINGASKVYIEKGGKKILTDVKFDDEHHLRYIVEKMLTPSGRRVDESYPYVDFSLEDGSRINVIIPPLSIGGSTVTVRKFLRSIEKVEDLVRLGTIDDRMATFLVSCIKAKINMLFSGATGSGKTSTLEVLSSYIKHDERVVIIEDALEINLRQEHVVQLLTKPPNIEGKGKITLGDLFRNTLRMRPTRVILGEIRGPEAMDYLQALNSGHRGCLAVIHASRPSDAIGRLATMASYSGLNIPSWGILRQISSGLNLIIQHEQFGDGSRKITAITEVGDMDENQIFLRDIFRYESEEIGEGDKIKGSFKAFGKPKFLSLFRKKGINIEESIFAPDGDAHKSEFWVK